MTRLWDKGEPLDDRIARLTVGRDTELDRHLVRFDAVAKCSTRGDALEHRYPLRAGMHDLCKVLGAIARDKAFTISVDDERLPHGHREPPHR